MDRRDLLKLSPLAAAATLTTVGHNAFAQAAAPDDLTKNSDGIFSVRHYGAKGDGKAVDTPAVQAAIDAAAAAGGGTVVFPAGIYLCFTIRLKSRVAIYLGAGATIEAAASPKPGETTGYMGGAYDAAEPNDPWIPYQDYGHNHWQNSLLVGIDIEDVMIYGIGLIHGKGLSNGTKGIRGGTGGFVAEQPGVGNKAIALKNCRNVVLRDFGILKGGHFALLATGVDNMTLDNLVVDTDRDGFDIDCCRNVRVSNCTVNSPWDDAICPKSSYALGYARSTDNVTIANNYVTGCYELGSVISCKWKHFDETEHVPYNGRIKCGTESNGGFRNLTITGNVIEGCKGISLESSDGALIEDVAITGNTLRDIFDAPLFLRLNRRNRNPKETLRPGTLRRVLISNLVSYNSNASTSSIFSGIPENLIEDVKLNNCFFGHKAMPTEMRAGWGEQVKPMPDWKTIKVPELEPDYPELLRFGATPSNAFFIRHLKNLEMSHVEVAPSGPDPRPAFWLEDVHRADFFAVTAPPQPNFALHNVSDLRIFWSRAGKDTTLAKVDEQVV
ncbi:Pectate lyase superfamily protein [Bryocella elongata]|uniref:Pectate lyase superfamily protein n=2 Tax=Bryocella elongata TaxID=863522 RepID=A0A1H5W3M9_9BACT|nr:Pectate lyase superfamily protein [Bryocella elongata]